MGQKRILAMYDIRGIQEYIFRTARVKDAIGASGIVEDVIYRALKGAERYYKENGESISFDLDWYNKSGVCPYSTEKEKDVQVLYIGGGNAFFTYRDRELCVKINTYMSKYIIDNTYSLQLAIAMEECSGDYKKDYEAVFRKMNQVKEKMSLSRPLGALPVMRTDVKTGYAIPYDADDGDGTEVEESRRKKSEERAIRRNIDREEKIFDNYITEKGLDSTLGVVHIDGNNMGLRIRSQIEKITDYNEAVMTMRRISYRINHAYKKVFEQMKEHFDRQEKDRTGRANSVLKILVAGDDITYICNGRIAIDTVEYFAKEIVHYTMDGKKQDAADIQDAKSVTGKQDSFWYEYPLEKETDEEKLRSMGFSVCAGIAYINSHFPFYAGYETAEACCQSAKDRAKSENYKGYSTADHCGKPDRVANWVDFQICKNVRAQNLKEMRKKEYVTSLGENLMLRPYFIRTEADLGAEEPVEPEIMLESFQKAVLYFQDSENIPRTFAKRLRNTYSQGEQQMELLYDFLRSRNWKLPNGQESLYIDREGKKTAKWYDALEMFDYYLVSKESEGTEAEGDE